MYIYESKKIRNDTKELLLIDKHKRIIFKLQGSSVGKIGDGIFIVGRGGAGKLSLH